MFKGLGNLANIGNVLKQAQEMGGKLKTLNEELKTKKVQGSAGGGMVEVEMNGVSEVLNVRIEQSLFDGGDKEMIEDLLPAAINAASTKAKELHAQAMQELTGGMNLPGLEEAMGSLGGDTNG